MAHFHVITKSPLTVQFWLYGLDVREGVLKEREFQRCPTTMQGSSVYRLGPLQLHSSGLTVATPEGELYYCRRTCRFSLDGQPLPLSQGLALCRPTLAEHERWVTAHYGPGYRAAQLQRSRLPRPVRRNLALWREYVGG